MVSLILMVIHLLFVNLIFKNLATLVTNYVLQLRIYKAKEFYFAASVFFNRFKKGPIFILLHLWDELDFQVNLKTADDIVKLIFLNWTPSEVGSFNAPLNKQSI